MWKPLAVLVAQLAFLNQIETYSHTMLIPLIVSVVYVSFIVLGTRFMKSRKPLALKGTLSLSKRTTSNTQKLNTQQDGCSLTISIKSV